MPKMDKTGPLGQGSRTGRGLGYCPGGYRGFGFGRGLGRGFGWSFRQPTAKEEKDMLNEELKYLKEDIKGVEKRLGELKE